MILILAFNRIIDTLSQSFKILSAASDFYAVKRETHYSIIPPFRGCWFQAMYREASHVLFAAMLLRFWTGVMANINFRMKAEFSFTMGTKSHILSRQINEARRPRPVVINQNEKHRAAR